MTTYHRSQLPRTIVLEEAEVVVHGANAGAGGPVFVLVHGIGTSHRYFSRLYAQLESVAATVSIDLPGFGGVPKPRQKFRVEDNARLLGATLDALGAGPVVLVGHSMGAQVVTELARTRPELVSHLVLIGPVTDPRRGTAVQQGLSLARDTLREPVSGNLIVLADYIRCGPAWFFSQTPSMLTYRTDLAVRSVVAPTLVIRGGNDPIARNSWCQRLADEAQDGELLEAPGERHLVQHSAAGFTAAGILGFVRSRPGIESRAL